MNKESREKLLIEIMQADEADGLYQKHETMNVLPDLYGEVKKLADQVSEPESIIIEIDLSGEKRSLMDLINMIRLQVNDRPDDLPVTLYFVAGNVCTNNDWNGLIDYINSLPNPVHAVYRGTVFPETVKVLTNFNTLTVDKSIKMLYIAEKLSDVLNVLLDKPELFRGFMEQWIGEYRYTQQKFIPISDLTKIGFKFEILGQ